jgi:hypothetical protein
MKIKNVTHSICTTFFLLLVLVSSGQNPDNNKYSGYYKNIPLFNIDISGYNYYTKTSKYIQGILEKDSLSLELKGFNKGDEITIVFSCTDPIAKGSVEKEVTMNNGVPNTQYFKMVTASAESRVLFLNKEGRPIYFVVAQPKKTNIEDKGLKRSTESEAQKDLKSGYDFDAANIKKRYIRELMFAYQRELDLLVGKFAKAEDLQIFTIDSKKFDYTDFNEASNNFIAATSTPDISTDANKEIILKSIAVWTKNLGEYTPDKKGKISDKNIDEIQFNLAMGYLAIGDGEKFSEFWKKCIDTKGSSNAETKAKNFMPQLVENFQKSIENQGKVLIVENFISDEQRLENMIVIKGFINSFLSSTLGNFYYIDDYFPANSDFVSNVTVSKVHKENVTENIKYSYGMFGSLSGLQYEMKGHPNGDKNLTIGFKYDVKTQKLAEITSNSNTLFTINYSEDGKKIAEILFSKSPSENYSFKVNSSEQGKIGLENYQVFGTGKDPKLISASNRIDYSKDFNVADIYLNSRGASNIKRDAMGNITELSGTDPADNKVIISFEIETDKMGNAIKSKSQFGESNFNYLYMY